MMRSNQKDFDSDEIQRIIFDKLRNERYKEEEEDLILVGIKNISLAYLLNDQMPEVSKNDILDGMSFLSRKYHYLKHMEKALSLKKYSWPLTEFAQSVDEYILSGDKDKHVNEIIYGKLSKDITNAIDIVSFCYGVLKQIEPKL